MENEIFTWMNWMLNVSWTKWTVHVSNWFSPSNMTPCSTHLTFRQNTIQIRRITIDVDAYRLTRRRGCLWDLARLGGSSESCCTLLKVEVCVICVKKGRWSQKVPNLSWHSLWTAPSSVEWLLYVITWKEHLSWVWKVPGSKPAIRVHFFRKYSSFWYRTSTSSVLRALHSKKQNLDIRSNKNLDILLMIHE